MALAHGAVRWHGYEDGALPTSLVKFKEYVGGNLKVHTKDGRIFDCHPCVRSCGAGDELITAPCGVYPIRWEE